MPAAHPHAPTVTVGRASRRFGGVVRAAVAVAVLAVLVLGPAAPASAHAQLTASDPTDGAVLDVAPAQVTLRFSEGVTVQPDGVRVLDRDATRVDGGVAEAQGSVVVAPVDQPLPPGGYVVAWRVVSADGHPVHGAFSFSVGTRTEVSDDVVANAFAGSADGRDELLGAILRAVAYVAILASAGAVWMGAALRRDDEPTPVGRVVTGLSAVGLLAVVLQVPVQASLATGQGLGAIGQEGVLGIALADGVGWSIAISGIGLIALLVTAGLPFRSNVRLLALAGAALAPLGLVVTGHTRTMSPAVVGYLADAAHVAAGAVWIGGLGALLAVVRRRRADDDVAGAARALATFSGWAGAVVAVVVAAGLALTWLEVGSLRALTSTTYGRYLMAKVAVALAVVAGAAWNRFRLVPAIVADADADADADAGAGRGGRGRRARRGATVAGAAAGGAPRGGGTGGRARAHRAARQHHSGAHVGGAGRAVGQRPARLGHPRGAGRPGATGPQRRPRVPARLEGPSRRPLRQRRDGARGARRGRGPAGAHAGARRPGPLHPRGHRPRARRRLDAHGDREARPLHRAAGHRGLPRGLAGAPSPADRRAGWSPAPPPPSAPSG
ncbi:MAG: copper resistance protein CopC [Acidimicrobiales bacterium]